MALIHINPKTICYYYIAFVSSIWFSVIHHIRIMGVSEMKKNIDHILSLDNQWIIMPWIV